MTKKNNTNMSMNDVFEILADISNSLYRIRKSGDLDYLLEDDFDEFEKMIHKAYGKASMIILTSIALGRIERENSTDESEND